MSQGKRARHENATRDRPASSLPAPSELAATLRPALRSGACGSRPLVLVAENQAALLEVVGRHFDGDAIAGQCLDAFFLHLAGGVGDDFVPCIELHAVARVGQDFGDQSLELDQLLFSHGSLQVDGRLAVGSLVAVGFEFRPAFAMQKGDALYPVSLAALRAGRLMPAALRSGAMITATAAPPARAFRCRCTVIVAMWMHAGRRPARAVLRRRDGGLAAALGAAVLAGQLDADQPFDVAQITHLLGARDQRDRHRSEEHTSELQSRFGISYAVFCLKKKK